ncbi:MAG: hypothetical protein KBA46_05830, partial [Candidatus Omnitrophica bacterium]|nr:hypothetical protein [Candidatus Omnitrophota bacterium]
VIGQELIISESVTHPYWFAQTAAHETVHWLTNVIGEAGSLKRDIASITGWLYLLRLLRVSSSRPLEESLQGLSLMRYFWNAFGLGKSLAEVADFTERKQQLEKFCHSIDWLHRRGAWVFSSFNGGPFQTDFMYHPATEHEPQWSYYYGLAYASFVDSRIEALSQSGIQRASIFGDILIFLLAHGVGEKEAEEIAEETLTRIPATRDAIRQIIQPYNLESDIERGIEQLVEEGGIVTHVAEITKFITPDASSSPAQATEEAILRSLPRYQNEVYAPAVLMLGPGACSLRCAGCLQREILSGYPLHHPDTVKRMLLQADALGFNEYGWCIGETFEDPNFLLSMTEQICGLHNVQFVIFITNAAFAVDRAKAQELLGALRRMLLQKKGLGVQLSFSWDGMHKHRGVDVDTIINFLLALGSEWGPGNVYMQYAILVHDNPLDELFASLRARGLLVARLSSSDIMEQCGVTLTNGILLKARAIPFLDIYAYDHGEEKHHWAEIFTSERQDQFGRFPMLAHYGVHEHGPQELVAGADGVLYLGDKLMLRRCLPLGDMDDIVGAIGRVNQHPILRAMVLKGAAYCFDVVDSIAAHNHQKNIFSSWAKTNEPGLCLAQGLLEDEGTREDLLKGIIFDDIVSGELDGGLDDGSLESLRLGTAVLEYAEDGSMYVRELPIGSLQARAARLTAARRIFTHALYAQRESEVRAIGQRFFEIINEESSGPLAEHVARALSVMHARAIYSRELASKRAQYNYLNGLLYSSTQQFNRIRSQALPSNKEDDSVSNKGDGSIFPAASSPAQGDDFPGHQKRFSYSETIDLRERGTFVEEYLYSFLFWFFYVFSSRFELLGKAEKAMELLLQYRGQIAGQLLDFTTLSEAEKEKAIAEIAYLVTGAFLSKDRLIERLGENGHEVNYALRHGPDALSLITRLVREQCGIFRYQQLWDGFIEQLCKSQDFLKELKISATVTLDDGSTLTIPPKKVIKPTIEEIPDYYAALLSRALNLALGNVIFRPKDASSPAQDEQQPNDYMERLLQCCSNLSDDELSIINSALSVLMSTRIGLRKLKPIVDAINQGKVLLAKTDDIDEVLLVVGNTESMHSVDSLTIAFSHEDGSADKILVVIHLNCFAYFARVATIVAHELGGCVYSFLHQGITERFQAEQFAFRAGIEILKAFLKSAKRKPQIKAEISHFIAQIDSEIKQEEIRLASWEKNDSVSDFSGASSPADENTISIIHEGAAYHDMIVEGNPVSALKNIMARCPHERFLLRLTAHIPTAVNRLETMGMVAQDLDPAHSDALHNTMEQLLKAAQVASVTENDRVVTVVWGEPIAYGDSVAVKITFALEDPLSAYSETFRRLKEFNELSPVAKSKALMALLTYWKNGRIACTPKLLTIPDSEAREQFIRHILLTPLARSEASLWRTWLVTEEEHRGRIFEEPKPARETRVPTFEIRDERKEIFDAIMTIAHREMRVAQEHWVTRGLIDALSGAPEGVFGSVATLALPSFPAGRRPATIALAVTHSFSLQASLLSHSIVKMQQLKRYLSELKRCISGLREYVEILDDYRRLFKGSLDYRANYLYLYMVVLESAYKIIASAVYARLEHGSSRQHDMRGRWNITKIRKERGAVVDRERSEALRLLGELQESLHAAISSYAEYPDLSMVQRIYQDVALELSNLVVSIDKGKEDPRDVVKEFFDRLSCLLVYETRFTWWGIEPVIHHKLFAPVASDIRRSASALFAILGWGEVDLEEYLFGRSGRQDKGGASSPAEFSRRDFLKIVASVLTAESKLVGGIASVLAPAQNITAIAESSILERNLTGTLADYVMRWDMGEYGKALATAFGLEFDGADADDFFGYMDKISALLRRVSRQDPRFEIFQCVFLESNAPNTWINYQEVSICEVPAAVVKETKDYYFQKAKALHGVAAFLRKTNAGFIENFVQLGRWDRRRLLYTMIEPNASDIMQGRRDALDKEISGIENDLMRWLTIPFDILRMPEAVEWYLGESVTLEQEIDRLEEKMVNLRVIREGVIMLQDMAMSTSEGVSSPLGAKGSDPLTKILAGILVHAPPEREQLGISSSSFLPLKVSLATLFFAIILLSSIFILPSYTAILQIGEWSITKVHDAALKDSLLQGKVSYLSLI